LFIKKLLLHGFKAFAEKTELQFTQGLGGFIGPNGCGKSNIIDAFKWVTGEQKISELRGAKMEDIIFNGSDQKSKSNLAEVEIVLENTEQVLPLDYNEVSIKRRLYRSGESEYLINNTASRLRDIQNLFLNTGIGTSTYSVIEQGKIGQILSSKSTDRRYLFEEAAAISKYKKSKRDYELRIEKARENLSRLNDIIKELEKQRGQLKEQADASNKFYKIQEKLKKEEINNYLYELINEKEKKNKITKRITQLQADINKIKQKTDSIDEKINQFSANIKDKEENVGSLEKKKIELNEKLNSLNQKMNLLTEQNVSFKQNIDLRSKDITHFKEEEQKLKQNIKKIDEDINKNKNLQENNKENLKEKKTKIDILLKKIENYNRENEQFNQRINSNKEKRNSLNKKHIEVVDMLIKEIDNLKRELDNNKKINQQTKNDIKFYKNDITAKIDNLVKADKEETLQAELNTRLNSSLNVLKDFLKNILTELFNIKNSFKHYNSKLDSFLKQKDPFFELIFSTEGTYAKKENIDKKIAELDNETGQCEAKILSLNNELKKCQHEINCLQQDAADIEINNAGIEQSLEYLQRNRAEKINLINSNSTRIKAANTELDTLKKQQRKTAGDIEKLKQQINDYSNENSRMTKKLSQYNSTLFTDAQSLKKNEEQKNKLRIRADTKQRKIYELEGDARVVNNKIDNIYYNCSSQYSEDLKQHENSIHNRKFDPAESKKKIKEFKRELEKIGSINPMAKTEYDQLNERLNHFYKQKKDVNISISDLINLSQEIDNKSEELFLNTFIIIKKNFNTVFRKLFEGGKADIILQNEKKPLESDIDIKVQPPGKKMQNINLFSGGEKAMMAIALMFSIFLVKPSPVCLLDEVDAPLDGPNIKRLSRMLNEFKNKTQFFIISHNQQTVTILDYVYGITMNNGVTKVLSVKF